MFCLRYNHTTAALALLGSSICFANQPGQSLDGSGAEVVDSFEDPPAAFAPHMFWFWDQSPDAEYAATAAAQFVSKGFSPGYVHPRYSVFHVFDPASNPDPGLPEEEWLSDAWFDAFGAALDEAKAAGYPMGYCDEYWWPSLRAQGRVLEARPDLRAQTLRHRVTDVPAGGEIVAPDEGFAVAARRETPAPPADAVSPRQYLEDARWVWGDEGAMSFKLAARISPGWKERLTSADLALHVDNSFKLLVNGVEIASGDDWQTGAVVDLLPHLPAEGADIVIEAEDEGGAAGVIGALVLTLENGTEFPLLTGGEGWFSEGGRMPRDLGAYNASPWNLSSTAERHDPTRIFSETVTILQPGAAPLIADEPGWRVYTFTPSPIPGDEVDYLNPETAQAFIEIAHKPYADRFPEDFGKAIHGVFVDNEGHYGRHIAWSEALDRAYATEWGSDIRTVLPLLLDEDVEGTWPAARGRWFETVSNQYADTMGTVSDWLEERSVFAISNFWEEHLAWQLKHCGSFFELQRRYTMPGTDCLQMKVLDPRQFIETRSVCAFEGRLMQTELMGAGGWEMFTRENIWRGANAAAAWGVSHVVPHGVFQEGRLEGNPWTPDWGPASPHWEWMDEWTATVRRNSWIVANSQPAPTVLLVNPMESAWALSGPNLFDPAVNSHIFALDQWVDDEVMAIDAAYDKAIKDLAANGVEALAADTVYLREARVEDARLLLRDYGFDALVLPPLHTASNEIIELAASFAESGGTVYALGALPVASTERGLNDPELAASIERLRQAAGYRDAPNGLQPLIDSGGPGLQPSVPITSRPEGILTAARMLDGQSLYWIANQGEAAVTVSFSGVDDKSFSVLDPRDGSQRNIENAEEESPAPIELTLEPLRGVWVLEGAM